MDERIVNLNVAERPVVTVKVGDRSYTIRRVVTGVRQLWSAFVVEQMTCMEHVTQFEKDLKSLALDASPENVEKVRNLTEAIESEVDAFYSHKIDTMLQIIELLLVKNGQAYERQWWLDNAEEADYRDFIMAVLSRDSPGSKKKEMEEGVGASNGDGSPSSSAATGPG
jgi:hypothetical protein